MRSIPWILVELALISCVQGVHHPNVSQKSFCYDDPACGPSTWKGLCRSGKAQSPIDIQVTPRYSRRGQRTEFGLNDHYLEERKHHFFGQNNGHTVQFELTQNTSALRSNLRLCGGELEACYKFAQLHFHWDEIDWDGSEHTVNGYRFPMELHIVHYKEAYNSLADALASEDRDAVAVMAVFFQISDWDNQLLDSIVLALENLRGPDKVLDFHLPLKIASFYPFNKEFARYYGSLTTPTCNEQVVWTVFLSPIPISEYQMDQFRRVRNEEGISDFNFRPVQPLNGRPVTIFDTCQFKQMTNT